MSKSVNDVITPVDDGYGGTAYIFRCPGCKTGHKVQVGIGPGPRWQFSGDLVNPTFHPSIKVESSIWSPPVTEENFKEYQENPWDQVEVTKICHSFIRNGKIEFLNDCDHEYKGMTVDLPKLYPEPSSD